MNTDLLLEVAGLAGKMLIESGAEIYRAEETMVRLCTSFPEVQDAQSFVTPTGIMFSIMVHEKTYTKILRVHKRSVDLHCIDRINALSRNAQNNATTLEEIRDRLNAIHNEKRYSFKTTLFFSALSAGGFAMFFEGTYIEAMYAFIIGMLIKSVSLVLEKGGLNTFFINAISAGIAAGCAQLIHAFQNSVHADIVIISSIMLLVPGLAITNAVRDTVAGDYLSGVARGAEAILIAVAIATGIGFVLSVTLRFQGGL